MLPASIYTRTASAATSSVGDASFESEQVEVGAWPLEN